MLLIPLNIIGSELMLFSICDISSSFQFNLIICQVPKLKKSKIKKYTKTEKKSLCFKENLTTPNINSSK